ncbi:MAG: CRTAC1 family protein [bacterium]|nr:CRTAC1 family protein [bacterium]
MNLKAASLIVSILLLTTVVNSQEISFADVTEASGVNVPSISTAESRYIIESMSGGAALFDCDRDGYLDIATVNGSSVDRFKKGGDPFLSLFRQVGGATSRTPTFKNMTLDTGIQTKGWGMGVTAVDYDNDGILDIFATGFGSNVMYRGLGSCKYADMTEKAGLRGSGFMTGAGWADFDRDGDLDVMIPRYVLLNLTDLPDFGSSQSCSYRGIRVQCGPRGLPGESDLFFRNRGDGTFEEVGDSLGLADKKKHFGLGAAWNDYDNDGWIDLYVANDANPNYLYKNNRGMSLMDVAFQTGSSYSIDGMEQGSMGVTWGDFDNDGLFDLFVTNFASEYNVLYRNLGSRGFLDVSMESKVGVVSKPFVGWGAGFFDFDNDGFLDLLVANGHVYPQMELAQAPGYLGFRQHFLLHRNLGNGTFEEVSKESGLPEVPVRSRRGMAFGDINNDGLIDAVVTSVGDLPTVLLNTTRNRNLSLTVCLKQPEKNRDSIGARLTLKTSSSRVLMREVEAGSSYLSQNDLRLHFGLGSKETVDQAEVRWSDGSKESVSGLVAGKIVTILKGKGIVKTEDLRRSRPDDDRADRKE